jgi:pyruvate/2-oxoglutarate/acetoin dehydrogenase E1 component|tara:strand:- start:1580 stop:2488 length:909 start_codon:yes stop_codon:yes gene_type:complete
MAKTVRETIKEITRKHLTEKNGLCFGQCLTAVGWVGGTLPEMYEDEGMVEVTTADVANGGFVVGAGLQGIRPIYVVRYQGFQWYNSPMIVNYASKSKEVWDRPCPIFIRSIAMEGGMGPVAGSSHHSLYQRMPGTKIISPMTPKEYEFAYKSFMKEDDVYYVSEHRRSYDNTEELGDVFHDEPDVVLFPISITRFDAEEARKELEKQGIKASIIHQLWIKPFLFTEIWKRQLNSSKFGGIVLDDDYEQGVASSIAHRMMLESDKKVYTMGLENRTAGFHKDVDNLPPTPKKIINKVLELVNG